MYLPEHYLLDVVGSQYRKKISHNLKEHKKNTVKQVKQLIVDYKLTKGDIRGKALKQLEL